MRGKKAGHFREVPGVSIIDAGGPCVLGRHFNGRQPSDLIRLLDKSSLGGRMRGIKIPQQDFALKMQGGGAYLRDTTVLEGELHNKSSENKSDNCILGTIIGACRTCLCDNKFKSSHQMLSTRRHGWSLLLVNIQGSLPNLWGTSFYNFLWYMKQNLQLPVSI